MLRCLLLVLVFGGQALAVPTLSLDPAFGAGGRVVHSLGIQASARKILRQPDGKVLVFGLAQVSAGSVRIVRFNPDGSLDTGFGTGGQVVSTINSAFLEAWHGGALLADGKIIVAGNAGPAGSEDFALARYHSDGSPDTGFGQNGVATLDFGNSSDTVNAIAVQPDGRIVAAGKTNLSHIEHDFAVARFNTDGSLDVGFANAGKFVLNRTSADVANAVIVQPNSRILVGGRVGPFCGVLRLTDSGADTSFGSGGLALMSSTSIGKDLALQHDGKILSVGDGLVRFNSNGSIDATFGNGGRVFLFESFLSAVSARPDGLIVVAGNSSSFLPGTDENFSTAVFDRNGNFITRTDTDFQGHERAEAIYLQPNGAVITAGLVAVAASPGNFGLAKYLGLPRLTPKPVDIDGDGLLKKT